MIVWCLNQLTRAWVTMQGRPLESTSMVLKSFASFVLFAGGDGGSICHIEGPVAGVGDTMPPSSCPGLT